MSPNEFRKLALGLPQAIESSHMNHPDFRIAGKIFASLGMPDKGWGMVKLTPTQQREVISDAPDVFMPCRGAWGRQGCTNVRLAPAGKAVVLGALQVAADNVASRPATRPKTAKSAKSMRSAYKPGDYSTVSPYLIVSGAAGTIEFLGRVFGALELRRFPDAQGKLMHAEVRIDDTVVMLADGTEDWPPIPAHVHVYVRDLDATYRRALEAGAVSVQAPVKKQDEDKRGGVKDAGGTTWWMATRVG